MAYWMKAQTQYALQSPYLYRLYGEVLYARLQPVTARRLELAHQPLHRRQYYEELYKLVNYFQPQEVALQDQEDAAARRCIASASPQAHILITHAVAEDISFCSPDGESIALLRTPYRDALRRHRWQQLQETPKYRVCIDLYDVGIMVDNPHLSPQYFLLKGWGW